MTAKETLCEKNIIPENETLNITETPSEASEKERPLLFRYLFVLFIVGCFLGMLVEGIYCLITKRQWEYHVTFLWGPFNAVYGAGAVGMYIISVLIQKKPIIIKFLAFALLGTVVEWLSGWIQENILHSVSWSYDFLNIGRYISIPFTIAWGILGVLFVQFCVPFLQKKFLYKMKGRFWQPVIIVATVLMIINSAISLTVLARWGERSIDATPSNFIEKFVDKHYPSEELQSRFVEWRMLGK